jgi:hypothetical protein
LNSVLNRVTEAAISVARAIRVIYCARWKNPAPAGRQKSKQRLGQTFSKQPEDSIARTIVRSGKPILLSSSVGNTLNLRPIISQILAQRASKSHGQVVGVLGVITRLQAWPLSLVDLFGY